MSTILKPLQYMLGVLLACSFIYMGLKHYAPGVASEARMLVGVASEWSEESKKSDPVGYLQYTLAQLKKQQDNIQLIVARIREQQQPLETQIQDETRELAKTNALLKDAKDKYNQIIIAKGEGKEVRNIQFAGRIYSEIDTFRQQLQLLFTEQRTKQQALEKMTTVQKQLEQRLFNTLAQTSKLDMAVNQIKAEIPIIQATEQNVKLDSLLADADKVVGQVLNDGTALIDENPVALTKDLWESSQKPQKYAVESSFDSDFEAFLKN